MAETKLTIDGHGDGNQQLPIRRNGKIIAAIRDEGTLADGHLFIAAPELLQTLIDLIPYIKECEQLEQVQPIQAQAIREVVSAAIAKVEPQ